MTEPTLVAAFLIGLLGSGHCLGMCGGIGSAIGLNQRDGRKWPLIASYNAGRVLTYTMLGLLAGLFGQQILAQFPDLVLPLRLIAGALLIAMGLYISGWWMGLTYLERAGSVLWRWVQPLTKTLLPVTSIPQALVLGALWGLLPCGLVYSTLGLAAAVASPMGSALIMFLFALGTLPSMLLTGLLGQTIFTYMRRQQVRTVMALLVMGMGVLTWWLPLTHLHPSDDSAHQHHHSMNG